MSTRHFVLFSGGLDSSAVLYNVMLHAHGRDAVEAVAIDYGQRHAVEMRHAQEMAKDLGIQYTTLRIPDLLMGSMLTSDQKIPNASYDDLPKGMSPTYVPFRNGLMISMIAAHAQKWVMGGEPRQARIYHGAHADDAANDAYPDCSIDFMHAMAQAVLVGTYHRVSLARPLIAMKKPDIIKYGARANVPFEKTWSCYEGKELHCGTCMTCRARKAGFVAAGIPDPTQYAA